MKAQIKTTANGYTFLKYYNSKEVYSIQGFDTLRKALNYAKKYSVSLTDNLPNGLDTQSINY